MCILNKVDFKLILRIVNSMSHIVIEDIGDNLICPWEAKRLLRAIRFRAKKNPAHALYYFTLLQKLVASTNERYLVPKHMSFAEWSSLKTSSLA